MVLSECLVCLSHYKGSSNVKWCYLNVSCVLFHCRDSSNVKWCYLNVSCVLFHCSGSSNVPNLIIDKDHESDEEDDGFISKEDDHDQHPPDLHEMSTKVDEEDGEHGKNHYGYQMLLRGLIDHPMANQSFIIHWPTSQSPSSGPPVIRHPMAHQSFVIQSPTIHSSSNGSPVIRHPMAHHLFVIQ